MLHYAFKGEPNTINAIKSTEFSILTSFLTKGQFGLLCPQ